MYIQYSTHGGEECCFLSVQPLDVSLSLSLSICLLSVYVSLFVFTASADLHTHATANTLSTLLYRSADELL